MVEVVFQHQYSQMTIIARKLSTMVGEMFKHKYSETAKINLSTMVEEIAKYQHSQMAINEFILSTIVVKDH